MSDKLNDLQRRIGISATYAASIGYFLSAFSLAEECMNRAIWAVLGVNSESGGHEVTTSVRDFGQRMTLLAKLGKARLKSDKNRKDCAEVVKALQFLNDRRVELVHGTLLGWFPGSETTIMSHSVPDRSKVKHRNANFSTSYLHDLAEYALTTADALKCLQSNAADGSTITLPSLDKRPEQSLPPRGSAGNL